MMFSGSQSYYDQYVHKNGLGKMVLEQSAARKPTLLTDRGAYLNYLEVQLERVSSACLTVQAYDERCNDLQGLLLSLDQKIQNLSKVVAATLEQNDQFKQAIQDLLSESESRAQSTLSQVHTRIDSLASIKTTSQVNRPASEIDHNLSTRVALLETELRSTRKHFVSQHRMILTMLESMQTQINSFQTNTPTHTSGPSTSQNTVLPSTEAISVNQVTPSKLRSGRICRVASRKVGVKVDIKGAPLSRRQPVTDSSVFNPRKVAKSHRPLHPRTTHVQSSPKKPEVSARRARLTSLVQQFQRDLNSRVVSATSDTTVSTTNQPTRSNEEPSSDQAVDTTNDVDIDADLNAIASALERLLSQGPFQHKLSEDAVPQHIRTSLNGEVVKNSDPSCGRPQTTDSAHAFKQMSRDDRDDQDQRVSSIDIGRKAKHQLLHSTKHDPSQSIVPKSTPDHTDDDMLHQPIITTDPLLSYRHKRDDLFRPSLESANTYLNEEERSDVNLIQSKQIPWRPNKSAQPLSWPLSKPVNPLSRSVHRAPPNTSTQFHVNRTSHNMKPQQSTSRYSDDASTLSSQLSTAPAFQRLPAQRSTSSRPKL